MCLDNMVQIRKLWIHLDFLMVPPDTNIRLNVESDIVTPLAYRVLHDILSIQGIRYTSEDNIQIVRGLHLQTSDTRFSSF